MQNLEIGGRTFRDIDSYNCARRDYAIICRIREKNDFTDLQIVNNIIKDIESEKVRFESLLGDDFLEELEEIAFQLESEKKNNTGNLSKKSNDKKSAKHKIKDNKNNLVIDDEKLQKEIDKQIKINEIRRKISLLLLGIIVLACLTYLVFYYFMYAKNDIEYENLASLIDERTKPSEVSVNIIQEDTTRPPVLKKYETLYQKNKKIVGWLKIDGTKIDYPVMQTSNNEYYLDHNFEQEYDKNGSIFMDKDCDPAHPNDNMIIYGHHMKSGKMFGNLNQYASEEYYNEHKYINFDTIYEEGLYEIMYVFRSKIYSEEEIVFKYYRFIDATSENEFYSNMDEMAAISLYDTGVTAQYGDRLITLSTCDYAENNGRFVVVAKKIK